MDEKERNEFANIVIEFWGPRGGKSCRKCGGVGIVEYRRLHGWVTVPCEVCRGWGRLNAGT